MKTTYIAIGLLIAVALSGCATLTGEPVKDCLNATNTASAASLASVAADANAARNPQSPNMQTLADLARAAFNAAEGLRVVQCRDPLAGVAE